MKRVLSGVQPSGQLHLGNYAGAIRQFVEMQRDHEMFVFVASYHALTSLRDAEALRANARQAAIDHLAFGLDGDADHVHIYLQQDVPRVQELAWLLACVCPKHMMDKQVAFKDKVAQGLQATVGLYTYPILQAADILAVDPDYVPVGEDQRQNLEIARDLAQKFNAAFPLGVADADAASSASSGASPSASPSVPQARGVFKPPEMKSRAGAATLPGIDGGKMSKSTGNIIDPFMAEKPLRKRIMKIVSDATPMEEPKDPDADATFQIFRGLAGEDDPRTRDLAEKYRAGNFGYGHAKQALFELILDHFQQARATRAELMNDPGYVEGVLRRGAAAANAELDVVLSRARRACGLQ
jgi:tryptophanyl-tRNA synthetase